MALSSVPRVLRPLAYVGCYGSRQAFGVFAALMVSACSGSFRDRVKRSGASPGLVRCLVRCLVRWYVFGIMQDVCISSGRMASGLPSVAVNRRSFRAGRVKKRVQSASAGKREFWKKISANMPYFV